MTNRSERTSRVVRLAMLGAVSIVLVLAVRFPLFSAASFLEYDPADIPILIAAFLYGPWWGLALTVVVSVIQGVTVSTSSGVVGIVMHILSTGAFCVVAGSIYRHGKTLTRAIVALAAGVLTMTAVMVGCNLVAMPLFMKVPLDTVVGMLVPIVIPFNLIKAGINAAVTFAVYKPISRLFARQTKARQTKQAPEEDARG